MVQKTINNIKKMCKWLEFYDKHGYLPFEKKKISITVDGDIYAKLEKIKNKSVIVNNLLKGRLPS